MLKCVISHLDIKYTKKEMAVLGEIRKRPAILVGFIALGLLAFVVNPNSIEKVFGKNPDVLGKVNGEKITREEFNEQLRFLQEQAQGQNMPTEGLEEQAWQTIIQRKLIKQEFDKLGIDFTEDLFWNQVQYTPIFAQNPNLFDEKGNFKVNELKKEIESLKSQPEQYNNWLRFRNQLEYSIMARMLLTNINAGLTISKKEAELIKKYQDQVADIDFVKVDYAEFLKKNPIKVTTKDLEDYIQKHPTKFKSQPTRNLGVVYFQAKPSAKDQAEAEKGIDKLLNVGTDANPNENFRNTTNDSMFVSLNSDMPFYNGYLTEDKLPQALRSQIATLSVGAIVGPYKEQDFLVVSKLLDKKVEAKTSTTARHILISYKGAQMSEEKRDEKEAKKLADSLEAVVKADPTKFQELVKQYSSDKGSIANGGEYTIETGSGQMVPEFQSFVEKSPKGATGIVKTVYGYHIINIKDKKSEEGHMTYKVANLIKSVKPSEATENEVDKNAKRFIQQVQGKSFNEFKNIAKKGNYQFYNPKSAKRFEGRIEGIGTEKASEILSWAFNKKREKGDTEIFMVDGTGDRIVVYLNGINDEFTTDPESVRDQIEPIVKNELVAKKIIEKIGKGASLDSVAKKFGTSIQPAQVNIITPMVAGVVEAKVAGAAFGVAKGKVSNPIEGNTGVYVILKKSEKINKQPGNINQVMDMLKMQNSQIFSQSLLQSLQDGAKIDDYRIEVWDKIRQN